MIATLTMNPSVDHYLKVHQLIKDDAIRSQGDQWFAGGKGINVSRVVHELGGRSCAFGLTGGMPGRMLTHWLDRAGIQHQFTEIQNETRINTTINDLSDNTQTHLRALGPKVSADELKRLCVQLDEFPEAPSFWVLAGSLPPGVPADFYRQLIFRLKKAGVRCVLDSDDQPLALGLEAAPFMIKPNEHEFQRLTGQSPDTEPQIIVAARRLIQKGVTLVLVTLGARGAVAVTEKEAFRVSAPPVKPRSRVGAGDSTIAGCLLALERGAAIPEAVCHGIAAGTAAVLTEGTTLCDRREVERLFPLVHAVPIPQP